MQKQKTRGKREKEDEGTYDMTRNGGRQKGKRRGKRRKGKDGHKKEVERKIGGTDDMKKE